MEIVRILAAVDFSVYSSPVLEVAIELAEKFGSELHLVHVCPDAFAFASPYEPSLPPNYDQMIEQAAEDHLREWREKNVPPDVSITEHLKRGSPAHQITALADEIGADLIVIGTRGLTGLRHVLMGSVAERTLRIAPCPVLTVKGDRDTDAE
jgi:universal stress protein A